MTNREVRSIEGLSVREADREIPTIVGHAVVFNELSEPIFGYFRERIMPNALDRAISERHDVRALYNHDSRLVLGRTEAGTLRMSIDDRGLAVEIDPPDNSYAHDLVRSIERGDVTQMSFGFIAQDVAWREIDGEEYVIREVNDLDLLDVSPVAYPAYPQTDVGVRGKDLDADVAMRQYHEWRKTRTADGQWRRALAAMRQKHAESI